MDLETTVKIHREATKGKMTWPGILVLFVLLCGSMRGDYVGPGSALKMHEGDTKSWPLIAPLIAAHRSVAIRDFTT